MFKVNKTHMMVGGVVVVLLAVMWYFRGSLFKSEGFYGGDAPSFNLYYADWCPHCKEVAPKFREWAKNGTVNIDGKTVFAQAVEEKSIPADMKDKVKGFPTFIFSKGGSIVEYSGSRDPSGWEAFIKQHA
jgi:thiol-disulfide isomerase/thioredoxin